MTKQEAYALGRVYGYVQTITNLRKKGTVDVPYASQRPISSMTQIISKANAAGVLQASDDNWIAAELDGVDGSVTSDGPEPVQPLPVQSSWQLGFYSGVDSAYETHRS